MPGGFNKSTAAVFGVLIVAVFVALLMHWSHGVTTGEGNGGGSDTSPNGGSSATTDGGNSSDGGDGRDGSHQNPPIDKTKPYIGPDGKTYDPNSKYPERPVDHWSNKPQYTNRNPRSEVAEERDDFMQFFFETVITAARRSDSKLIGQCFSKIRAMGKDAVPYLEKEVQESAIPTTRNFSLRMLREFNIEENREMYKKLCDDPDHNIRLNALFCLAHLGGDDVMAYIDKNLKDPNEEVRRRAKEALTIYRSEHKQ